MNQIFRLFQAQSAESGSRTDVLKPMVYAMGILFASVIGLVWRNAPVWLLVLVGALLVLVVLTYVISYAFCLLSNPDLLRSETYGLRKMAIERGMVGDSDSGLVPLEQRALAIPTQSTATQTGNAK